MATNRRRGIDQRVSRISDLAHEPTGTYVPITGYANEPTVSLENAVEPLVSFLPTISHNAARAKRKCKNPPRDGLTLDESASIMLYSMEWDPHNQCLYIVLNETLRSGDRSAQTVVSISQTFRWWIEKTSVTASIRLSWSQIRPLEELFKRENDCLVGIFFMHNFNRRSPRGRFLW